MPPRSKITKPQIVEAAIALIREEGADALNARSLAARLSSSTQPIFSNFASMDELRRAVAAEALRIYDCYTARLTESGEYPIYKAAGMAYIGFAGEERELFKLLYMRPWQAGESPELANQWERSVSLAGARTGLDGESATLFHLEMWAFVHGIATMIATRSLVIENTLISEMLTDAFMGLSSRFKGGVK